MTLPKPYYQDSAVTIYNADCREILPFFPDKSFDLVLTDPPYGLNTKMNGGSWGNTAKNPDEFCWDYLNPEVVLGLVKMTAIIWGGNYYNLPPTRCWLSWVKTQRMPSVADFELAWTNLDKPSKLWIEDRNPDRNRQHPTQKPISLFKWCIEQVDQSNLILDPFLGSGTTAVAAKILGRKCVGIEISEKYCEIAARRCSQSVMQLEVPKTKEVTVARLV